MPDVNQFDESIFDPPGQSLGIWGNIWIPAPGWTPDAGPSTTWAPVAASTNNWTEVS